MLGFGRVMPHARRTPNPEPRTLNPTPLGPGMFLTILLPSEKGTTRKGFKTFPRKRLEPRPESGLDCLIYAEFSRQRPPKRRILIVQFFRICTMRVAATTIPWYKSGCQTVQKLVVSKSGQFTLPPPKIQRSDVISSIKILSCRAVFLRGTS